MRPDETFKKCRWAEMRGGGGISKEGMDQEDRILYANAAIMQQ